jgi:hypothetical protein
MTAPAEPLLLAVPLADVDPAYRRWVIEQTQPKAPSVSKEVRSV